MPKGTTVRVRMLDDTINQYEIKPTSYGNVLLQAVMKDLDILESDYFGSSFDNGDGLTYLDPLRQLGKQIKNFDEVLLEFGVKFFSPDPSQMQDEYTRYLFALQVKRDINTGILPCAETTAIEIASNIVQAEFGDWNATECADTSYLKDMKLFPNPTEEQLQKISESHRNMIGKKPADADYSLLDIARRLELYGVRLFPALDAQSAEIALGVSHAGVLVFQGTKRINNFNWARIRKLSFKRKRFLIKLRVSDTENQRRSYGDILIFVMKSRDACKNFWRICIEHHSFFRLEVRPTVKPKPLILSRGSSFHYNGKTQKELLELVRNSNFRRTNFIRTTSRRRLQNSVSGTNTDNDAKKAKPDLPLQDLSINQSHNANTPSDSVTSPSMSSTVTEDQGSYRVDDSSRSMNTDSNVTTADISPDSSQRSQMPEWQLESKSLHSSATPISEAVKHEQNEAKDTDKGNEDYSMAVESSVPKVNLHSGGQQSSDDATTPTGAPSPRNMSQSSVDTRELKMSYVGDARHPTDQAYYIAKEFLVTERNYIKDLEVVDKAFKSALVNTLADGGHVLPDEIANQIFNTTDSLLSLHKQFKLELESRMVSWENPAMHSDEKVIIKAGVIDDILIAQLQRVKKIFHLIENGEDLVRAVEKACDDDERFDQVCRDFELEKICYIPITRFLLQPVQRVIHYALLYDRLVKLYTAEGCAGDHDDLRTASEDLAKISASLKPKLLRAHNFQKLAQLRHDLIGVDNLLLNDREFVREGSLYKLSRKGFQQRLFFLFSGCLIYTSKGVTSTNQFKIHGELPLQGMIIEINDSIAPNCFSILSGSKTVVVAASTQEEMSKWIEDLNHYINLSKDRPYLSPLTAGSTSRPVSDQSMDQSDDSNSSRNSLDPGQVKSQNGQQRTNTTMHVCWHRNTSVSADDYFVSLQNQLCGYLLRKFKNSNGWQKLWVVFTNFSLFFYKSHQDESSLASLPLLGYSATQPSPDDNIQKEFVFKLQFKTHVYFFRAESQYTFSRWMEVIRSATGSAKLVRLFSRMDSTN